MDKQALELLRPLPIGVTNFAEIIHDNFYYIDKTPVIKDVFSDSLCKVMLVTRPRRFGKTLLMNTFANFLKINPENPDDTSYQDMLFKNTRIYEDQAFCKEFMGKWPVISISFKDIGGNDFKTALGDLATAIAETAGQHKYLLQSDKLDESEKDKLKVILNDDLLITLPKIKNLRNSLRQLSDLLYHHYGKKVIVLIDEYDVPLAKAYSKGYYNDMVDLIQTVLSSVLKDNDYLKKGVLTGCLRVSKESIFTGLNNPKINTVIDKVNVLSEGFGFSKDEVKTMLDYYDLSEHEGAVKDWYDGYRIGGKEIFCPWDVISFCDLAMDAVRTEQEVPEPQSFWTSTSSNFIIEEFMSYLKEKDADDMQTLLDGGEIEFSVNEDLNYREIGSKHKVDDFWTMMLYTGYLTAVKTIRDDIVRCRVRIPNREIRSAFNQCIASYYKDYYSQESMQSSLNELVAALANGDCNKVRTLIKKRLKKFVSVRDWTNSKPECFYQGFLNGIFSSNTDLFDEYQSNEPSGDGYADISFSVSDDSCGVIIELKSTKDQKSMPELAKKAMEQIKEKRYIEKFENKMLSKIYCYGIVFCRKDCLVQCEVIELESSCL